ncbi:MAG: 5-oxoprolinase subunit B family protein [Candidatus Limnocylindria bacterium]
MTRVVPFGEAAVLVELEQRVDPAVAARAAAIADAWERLGHGPAVPTYAAALLCFDPLALEAAEAEAAARDLAERAVEVATLETGVVHEIPTRYGGEDLEEVARLSGLSVPDLIAAHTGRDHLAFFLGFMPGFAYLGEIDPRIVAPRLEFPRSRVPAGAVAVADGQTAVYPATSPGGWRLIGSTDARMFDPQRDPPALIRSGDRVRFVAVE